MAEGGGGDVDVFGRYLNSCGWCLCAGVGLTSSLLLAGVDRVLCFVPPPNSIKYTIN